MNNKFDILQKFYFYKKYVILSFTFVFILFTFVACQKNLKLKYDNKDIKQVLVANFTPNNYLRLSISKSKFPDDFNPVEFLNNCKVDLYENNVFIETLPFVLKDTLSSLGFYTSSFSLQENKTYKIISTHELLGTTSAEEYLPPFPNSAQVSLLQHADTAHPNVKGKYMLTFQDSANAKNYYTIAVYYKGIKTETDTAGNITEKTDYLFNVPSYNAEIPNTSNYYKSFFNDANFDGQLKSFVFDFKSEYDNYFTTLFSLYKEIYLIVEFVNVGPGYYSWNVQQLPVGENNFNNGQNERTNISSNINNGYGHFSAWSAIYKTIRIK